ncbi:MAG TPA: 23S rRNA (guanosine(2251)-2'-O)-methyltransferase RlmB [Stellaceae bacterium]|nr:23S rRNA (guanosine(2251)-2'-O)-methyltransferase RlmB [Stellaceae bacterium]
MRPQRGAQGKAAGGESSPWLYGHHAVAAALGNPRRRLRRLVSLAENAAAVAQLAAAAAARLPAGELPEVLPREAFDELLHPGAVHQGIAALAEPLPTLALDELLSRLGPAAEDRATRILMLLDRVSDPHNVGAVLRSAAVFGALGVVLPEHGAPPVTGALAKAASGALEAVPLLRVTNLVRCLERLKEAGFWCVGLDSAAPQSLEDLDLPPRIALALGAEGAGLRRLVRERCDFLAHLPTRGSLASLNVSNAAAVALYALTRPR